MVETGGVVSFTVRGKAEPAGSKRAFVSKAGRAIVTDDNAKSKPWKQEVADMAAIAMEEHRQARFEGAVELYVRIYRKRPNSHYRERGGLRPSAPVHDTKKPDLLKMLRAIEDAMTGIVYRDDAQIVTEVISKEYTEEEARVKIEVRALPGKS